MECFFLHACPSAITQNLQLSSHILLLKLHTTVYSSNTHLYVSYRPGLVYNSLQSHLYAITPTRVFVGVVDARYLE